MPQDFSGQNLRGHSFKGQDLTGANFNYADIRGANFTNANLRGADFKGAKAGLQRRWAIGLTVASWLLSGLSGGFSVFIALFLVNFLDTSLITITKRVKFIAGVVYLVALAIFFIVTVRKGLGAGLGAGAFAAFAFAGVGAVARAFARAFAFARAVAVAIIFAFGGAGALLGTYIGWRGLAGDEKHAWVRPIAIAFAAKGGTSFRGADLTDADFTNATLKSTDLRGAILTRTCWHQAKMLDRVRPGITYLQNAQLRQVLIIGQGQDDKNFDRQDLRGVNLKGANLADASFIGADLSKANLQDADLSRAKLVQTQLDETDLTGATLTGAYIEDWGITSHTKLNEVRCDYVFMRLPTKENPNPRRKPDNWEEKFEDGDFADFIKPIFDTLDLYHNQGVDPRAIAISFKQLAEKHPDAELRIVGMEVRGEDKFLLRAKTAPDADKSKLSAEYFSTYNQFKGLSKQEFRLLLLEKNIRLEEKDNQIRKLESMVNTALQPSKVYSETHIEKVETMSHNPGGISQNVSGGQVYGGMQAAQGDNNQQTQETHVAGSNEKQLTQQEVIQMLAQIEELVGGNPELPEADKEKSLKYLGAAKAEVREPEPDKQLVAGSVKRMSETLKTASETVASSKTLWENVKPILVQLPGWLGVAKNFFGF